eukprot:2923024-Prymnesium_polylepis.1
MRNIGGTCMWWWGGQDDPLRHVAHRLEYQHSCRPRAARDTAGRRRRRKKKKNITGRPAHTHSDALPRSSLAHPHRGRARSGLEAKKH